MQIFFLYFGRVRIIHFTKLTLAIVVVSLMWVRSLFHSFMSIVYSLLFTFVSIFIFISLKNRIRNFTIGFNIFELLIY